MEFQSWCRPAHQRRERSRALLGQQTSARELAQRGVRVLLDDEKLENRGFLGPRDPAAHPIEHLADAHVGFALALVGGQDLGLEGRQELAEQPLGGPRLAVAGLLRVALLERAVEMPPHLLGQPVGVRGLRELITVWGDGKLNLNTAPYEVLAAIPRLDEEVLDAIVAYRNGGDGELGTGDDRIFKTMGQVGKKLDVSAEKLAVLQTYCKTTGFVFTVEALATRRQGKINAFCDVTVSIQTGEVKILQWRENPIGT